MEMIQCGKCRKFGTFVNSYSFATCDNCGSQRKIVYGTKQIVFSLVLLIVIVIGATVVQYQKPPESRDFGPLNGLLK
jgi:hypothetical protein